MIPLPHPLLPATFLRRENRFRAALLLDDGVVAAHIPNSGRLGELLVSGALCYLSVAADPARRTPYDLRLVSCAGTLVSVDARLPNLLLVDALERHALPAFDGYVHRQREAVRGHSRLDFLLQGEAASRLWVETKSVTLVEDDVALFPDAPTARGQKHLRELVAAVEAGDRAAIVFIVQRADAYRFAPHSAADPAFSAALARAVAAGVMARAYTCRVEMAGIELANEIGVAASGSWGHGPPYGENAGRRAARLDAAAPQP
jgi:sugar fermentation stimulation protein A